MTHAHDWRFDGDDPYIVCDCGERRDALTSAIVNPLGASPTSPSIQERLQRHDERAIPGVQRGIFADAAARIDKLEEALRRLMKAVVAAQTKSLWRSGEVDMILSEIQDRALLSPQGTPDLEKHQNDPQVAADISRSYEDIASGRLQPWDPSAPQGTEPFTRADADDLLASIDEATAPQGTDEAGATPEYTNTNADLDDMR